jgi:hypothetical protein
LRILRSIQALIATSNCGKRFISAVKSEKGTNMRESTSNEKVNFLVGNLESSCHHIFRAQKFSSILFETSREQ